MTPDMFWNWFEAEAHRLLNTPADRAASEVNGRLRTVNALFTAEISDSDPAAELIVSAAGIGALFPQVREIVAAAPPIPGWTITALKPAKGFKFTLSAGGALIQGSSLKFMPLTAASDPDKIAVRIAFPQLEAGNGERRRLLLLALLTGIGEELYDEIDAIQIADFEVAPTSGWLPIEDLTSYIKRRRLQV